MGHAAVCGEYAANLYGLNIIEKGIETNKRNFTRFLILADPLLAEEIGSKESEINKSSIVFTLPHSNGSFRRCSPYYRSTILISRKFNPHQSWEESGSIDFMWI